MKKLATKILRNFGQGSGLLAMFTFATAGAADAGEITKTFEFGAVTANSVRGTKHILRRRGSHKANEKKNRYHH